MLPAENDQFPFHKDYIWEARTFLGQGSFGKVFKVQERNSKNFVAIKQISMQFFQGNPQLLQLLKEEFVVNQEVKGEHVVTMTAGHIDTLFSYMILEICDGDLAKILTEKKLSQAEVIHIFSDILHGCKNLVAKDYIHRDIKPANILIKKNIYKIADFGFSCKADINCQKKLTQECGTPLYMSPQLLTCQAYTAKTDIWSLGIMLFEMIFGFQPWPCKCKDEFVRAVTTRPLAIPYNAKIGENTLNFLKRSLVVDQNARMSWVDVFNHPLFMHKESGVPVKSVAIDGLTKKFLASVQTEIKKRKIDIKKHFQSYSAITDLNLQKFTILLMDLCPQITTHEIETIFNFADADKDETVSVEQFQKVLSNIDFRDADDTLIRQIEEIATIISYQSNSLQEIFKSADLNRSNQLDFSEFSAFILKIAPKYQLDDIRKIFKAFDNDNSGRIDFQQFEQNISEHISSPKTDEILRIELNLKNFQQRLLTHYNNLKEALLLKIKENGGVLTLDEKQFADVAMQVKFAISKAELREIFVASKGEKKSFKIQI